MLSTMKPEMSTSMMEAADVDDLDPENQESPQPELEAAPLTPPGRTWDAPVAFGPSRDPDVYEDDDDDGRWNPEAHQH